MSSPSDNPRNWFDEELRNVPLPEGLTARLKEIAAATDDALDAALRDVSVPEGLLAQLKSIPAEAEFDRRLQGVPVPTQLLGKLHAITAYGDDELDAQLRDVELPAGLHKSLQDIVRKELVAKQRRVEWVQYIVAASLLLTVSLACLGATGNLLVAMFDAGQAPTAGSSLSTVGIELFVPSDEDNVIACFKEEEAPSDSSEESNVTSVEIVFDPPQTGRPAPDMLSEVRQLFSTKSPGFVDPLTDVFLAKHDFLVAPIADTVPPPTLVDAWQTRGVTPPLVPAAQWQRLIIDGKFPLVSPAADPLLRSVQVPLLTSSSGYDLAWRELLAGRLPSTELTRTEDFLSALQYPFEAPTATSLGLRTAAGPSPFGETGYSLLQIGVAAAAINSADTRPVRLTLVLDASASVRRAGKLGQVQRALARLTADLQPTDRVSILLSAETPEVVLEDASPAELARFAANWNTLPPAGTANLAGGLREAALLARRTTTAGYRQRLVLLTEELDPADPAARTHLPAMAADLAQSGIPVDVVHLQSPGQTSPGELLDLARTGTGQLYAAESTEGVRRALLESAAGGEQIIARGAQLKVTFRPEVVAEYRLLGHEPTGGGGLVGGPLEVNLHAGETATALFEMKLKATGGDDVGTAVVSWIEPGTGKQQQLTQRISRLQFATSLAETPLSLQQAAVAAQAAEVLRLSKSSAARTLALKKILQQAELLSGSTRSAPAFAELLRLVDLALQVQTGRAGH